MLCSDSRGFNVQFRLQEVKQWDGPPEEKSVVSCMQAEPHPPTWVWLRLMSLALYILLDAEFSTVHV